VTQADHGLEPAPPSWTGVVAVFESLEISPHSLTAPAGVIRGLGDLVPILRRTAYRDHRVVDGAAADALGPRIENSAFVFGMRRWRWLSARRAGIQIPFMDFGVSTVIGIVIKVLDEEAK